MEAYHKTIKNKSTYLIERNAIAVQVYYCPWGFQEYEAHRFRENRNKKVVSPM